jgi:hypothetical protein
MTVINRCDPRHIGQAAALTEQQQPEALLARKMSNLVNGSFGYLLGRR